MIDTPTIALAFTAGLISFLSPCCLPLVPGYLATVTGVNPSAAGRRVDPAVIGRSLLFVGTFSLLFILLGLSATLAGELLFDSQQTLNMVAGALVIAMGVFFMSSVFVERLGRDFRPRGLVERAGRGGPVVAGAAFAIAWTPCVGPTLGAILGIAATQDGTVRGAVLLTIYSAGLALPFIASAVAFNAASASFGFLKRHHAAIQLISGAVLVGMGVLVLTNQLFRLNIEVQQFLDGFGVNFFQSI